MFRKRYGGGRQHECEILKPKATKKNIRAARVAPQQIVPAVQKKTAVQLRTVQLLGCCVSATG